MSMVGDGPEGQPTEGVVSLDSLASQLDGGEQEQAPDESAESEEAEESELGEESEQDEPEQEAAEEGEEQAEEQTFTIKVDGKDVVLKQSELIEQAQKGFDYTQKTMAVAEQRKAVEAARESADKMREFHANALAEQIGQLQAFEQFISAQVGEPPHISLAQQDAAQYLAQRELYENRKGQLEQAQQRIQYLQQEQHRQRQAALMQQAEATERALRDTLPGWNDETLDTLAKYAGSLGLTPDKVDVAFVQEGFWSLLHKAKAYDELQAKRAQMKPVAKLPKVAKPGNNNQPPQLARRQEAFKTHKAKGTLNSLADLL